MYNRVIRAFVPSLSTSCHSTILQHIRVNEHIYIILYIRRRICTCVIGDLYLAAYILFLVCALQFLMCVYMYMYVYLYIYIQRITTTPLSLSAGIVQVRKYNIHSLHVAIHLFILFCAFYCCVSMFVVSIVIHL